MHVHLQRLLKRLRRQFTVLNVLQDLSLQKVDAAQQVLSLEVLRVVVDMLSLLLDQPLSLLVLEEVEGGPVVPKSLQGLCREEAAAEVFCVKLTGDNQVLSPANKAYSRTKPLLKLYYKLILSIVN